MSTGMPAGIWLGKFGVIVRDYFGHVPYHVGSSLKSKEWRDVDVRLIMPDEEFAELFGCNASAETNPKLASVTLAFAALGQHMTGLPIDFQIQPQSHANKVYPGPRSALIELREGDRMTDPAPAVPHIRVLDPDCPTCQTGPSRKTVGMVCQTCGTDYAPEGGDPYGPLTGVPRPCVG